MGVLVFTGHFSVSCFGVLALFNVASIFVLWKRHHLRAFLPLGTLAFSVVASFLVAGFGTRFVLRNTPNQPDSFFNNQTKAELTDTAGHLVGNGFKEIILQPDKPAEVRMIAGRQRKEIDPKILAVLSKYGFVRANIDDRQEIVMFSYYHLRTSFDYIWAKNGLSEPDLMPSTITEVDIEDWTELIRIAKHSEGSGAFYPSIVYPYLNEALGSEMLNQFGNSSSTNRFTEENKNAVLTALNKQRLASNALAEQPDITYGSWQWGGEARSGLCIANTQINDGFWVTTLLKQLLSDGVLTLAPDGHHLKIKANLTDKQRLQVEWFHIGIMNFVYGNLLEKRQYPFQKKLGDNWYFNRS